MKRLRHLKRQLKKSSNAYPALFLAAALVLAGCPGSEQAAAPTAPAPKPATQPIAPPKPVQPGTPPAVASAPMPSVPEETYSYKPAGRRDPFAPIVVREEKKEKRTDLPPLERHAVTEFKLTGIVWGGFGYNAMLEGPDGKGYFVRVGTVMGQNRGVVKKITKDSLIVEEKFKNYMGVTERKEITITLHKKQEGMP